MTKRKSKRVKDIKNFANLLSNDEDDDFEIPTVNKKAKKEILTKKSKFNESTNSLNNEKKSIADMLRSDKPRESLSDRLFQKELEMALEISKDYNIASNNDSNDHSDMPSLQIYFQNKSFNNQENITEEILITNSLKNNLDIPSLDIYSERNLDTKDNLKMLNIKPINNDLAPPNLKPNITLKKIASLSEIIDDVNKCKNITKIKGLKIDSKHLSPLQGNLRLGLSRKNKVKSLHLSK